VLIYRFDAPLFYANAEVFRARGRALVHRHAGTRAVILDASAVADIDVTAGRMLGELQDELARRGVRLVVANAVAELDELLVGDELRVDFVADDMFDTIDEALAAVGAPAADELDPSTLAAQP
jgi:MFS superfamily sulfate permease-like transporter